MDAPRAMADFETLARERFEEVGGDVDLDAMATVLSLVRVTNRITADIEASVYRPQGVSYAGSRVLFIVWLHGPLEPHRIAALGSVSAASVSSALNTLEQRGLVSRRRESADRRLVTVGLTDEGLELMRKTAAVHNRRERAWLARLSNAEQTTLRDLLHQLLEHRPPE